MPSSPLHLEILAWRKVERRRLIDARLAIGAEVRRRYSTEIAEQLSEFIGVLSGRTVSAYWPFRGEPDLRPWIQGLTDLGARFALPVVVEKNLPLIFRIWQRGQRLVPGIWNIPVPADGVEVIPDIIIAPVVGFDSANYRLGYGGGFFDRTLAALPSRPVVIGVGYAQAAIASVYPLPHDIPMDVIVTERGPIAPSASPQGILQ
jgi:5-formyltetrahydrofolate cyclo-ligase